MALNCDGWCEHKNPVAMIGSQGFAYCTPCGQRRRGDGHERVRKLRPHELRKLQRGEPLARY